MTRKVKCNITLDKDTMELINSYDENHPETKGFNISAFCNAELKKKLQ